MPTLKQLVTKRLDRLDSVPAALETTVERVQKKLFSDLQRLMGSLNTKGGFIVLDEYNLTQVDSIVNLLVQNDLLQGEYREALKEYLRQFGIQGELQDQYFEKIIKGFDVKPIYQAAIRSAQVRTLDALTEAGLYSPFMQPIKQQLAVSITTGERFSDAVARLEGFMLGNDEVEGRLLRYVKGIAYDAFAFNDRNYGQIVGNDLGLEFARYQGGLIKDSREFCIERNGGYYHREEIASWGDIKQWQGRAQGTDESTIFTFLGGYNCKHSLVWVSESDVPPEILQTAIDMGWYKPSKRVAERLGVTV